MKTRLTIVMLAVMIGMAWKLGRGDFHADQPVASDATSTSTSTSDTEKNEDPLVPPAQVPGLMPVWRPGDTSTTFSLTSLIDEFAHDNGAIFHAHGDKVCASGCAASSHPTEELGQPKFEQLLARYAVEPMSEDSPALESLLYYGRQTRRFLETDGFGPLDADRSHFLWRELSRTHARVSIRLVDEYGEIRSWIPSTKVPFDRRHVFDMKTDRVQPLVTSGTVKRVGLYHIWARL